MPVSEAKLPSGGLFGQVSKEFDFFLAKGLDTSADNADTSNIKFEGNQVKTVANLYHHLTDTRPLAERMASSVSLTHEYLCRQCVANGKKSGEYFSRAFGSANDTGWKGQNTCQRCGVAKR